ncbi:MAG: efflux RND transporter permease subunit [Candidatus Hatepunaea meridiana]|nr:efflux RND transporter permease subunit [Candidatus Hatepunaea meridiana]
MKLADISIRRPVMMTMVIFSFVVIGLFSLTRLGIDLLPEIELPYVIVSIIYPGAGPEEMETQVAEPIEEEVSAIGGVKHVTSFAQEGLTMIIIEFNLEMDVDIVAIDVRDKVDQLRYKLPEDILDPIIQKFDIGAFPIINLAVSSSRPLDEIYELADNVVKPGLSRVRGLADIQLTGGLEREIQINLSRRKLRAYNLSPQVVSGMIASENLNIPAGHITEGKKEITVRLAGEFNDIEQIKNIEIPIGEGKSVKLEQLGWVEDTFAEQRERARFAGEASVGVSLIKRSDANTVEVAKAVFKEIEKVQQLLPDDVRLDVARDMSQFIQDSVDDVFGNMIIGILLTVIVLYLFLHSIPITLIAAVSMPVSIISTFILVDFAGFTLNMMSLMGLAISVGILVTNSIVVLENIIRYRLKGLSLAESASKGTGEIAVAVAAATLTNIVVFLPMAFMSGIIGQFFKQFGLTVAFATLFSLLVSFTLAPMMASITIRRGVYAAFVIIAFIVTYWLLGIDQALILLLALVLGALAHFYGLLNKFAKAWDRFYNNLALDYKNSLKWALKHRFIVLGTVTLLFIGSLSILGLGYIGSEFMPKTDEGSFSINVEMPIGTTLNETDRIVNEISQRVMQQEYVKSVYAATGKSEGSFFGTGEGTHMGSIVVQMVEENLRPIKTSELIKDIRPQLIDLPGAKINIKETSSMGGGGGESDLQVEITGYDIDYLNTIADSLIVEIKHIGGMVNVESSWKTGKPELKLTPRRSHLADRDLSPAMVGMTLRSLLEGEVASKFRDEGEEYDVRVQLDKAEIERAVDVGDVYIKAGDNQILLSELINSEYTEGPTSISHKDKQRMVVVSADLASGVIGDKVKVLRKYTDNIELKPGYRINFGGEAEMMQEAFTELFKALILAIILTYMLLAAILESYKHPFTIMLTLPLGLVGVILALFITDNTISILSLMALVMLVGIVVNNGILLIDYINRLRKEGYGLDDSIIEACPVRLRPIIMTNIATALGMLPLALGIGSGGEMRAPMAIVAIGGLITSAVFTLFVIPVIYRVFERE